MYETFECERCGEVETEEEHDFEAEADSGICLCRECIAKKHRSHGYLDEVWEGRI